MTRWHHTRRALARLLHNAADLLDAYAVRLDWQDDVWLAAKCNKQSNYIQAIRTVRTHRKMLLVDARDWVIAHTRWEPPRGR